MPTINVNVEETQTHHVLVALLHFVRSHYVVILPLFIVFHYLRRRYASPLRVWSTASGHTELDHIALHQRYGPIVRIGPNEVSFSSPTVAREVLQAGKGFHKTDFYGVFPPPENPDIFTETREAVHAQKKRVASMPYSMKAMQSLTGYVEDTIDLLRRKVNDFAKNPEKPMDLGDWLHYFAFDVLGEVAFSRKFGFLQAGYDLEGAIKTIDDSQWYNGIVGQVPFFDRFLRRNPLWQYVPFLSTKNALITRMARSEMEDRSKSGSVKTDRMDLLGQLMKGHADKPDQFGEGDVFAVAHGAIFAGSDSTASTMQSFMHLVLKHPPVYRRLVTEITSAATSGSLSPQVQFAEAQALPYFQACLKEAMRLRPAVGLNITRLVPPGGATLSGRFFPAGTRVAVNGWVLHRDTSTFGSDAESFRPERWLPSPSSPPPNTDNQTSEKEEEARIREMDRHMFQFGGGSHLCIGKNLALLEMNKVLPTLLRDYRFQLVSPDQEMKWHSTFFVVQRGLVVYVKKAETEKHAE
ncbi:MAG: hypothetical protein Q9227_007242 [Pyrenula ochraceoflavens]